MMKPIRIICLAVLALLSGCRGGEKEIPLGEWVSVQGRAMIRIAEKDGGYSATVFHRTSTGGVCPIEYPLVTDSFGMYIRAEGRIAVSYSHETNRLFLSPGGLYVRSSGRDTDLP